MLVFVVGGVVELLCLPPMSMFVFSLSTFVVTRYSLGC